MEEHSLRVLEFDKIVARVREQTACALGGELADKLAPAGSLAEAQRRQSETAEARAVLQFEGKIPLGGIEDIRPQLHRALIGGLLQPSELLSVLGTLQSTRRLAAFLTSKEHYPILGEMAGRIELFEQIEAEIGKAISQAGEVVDDASPALARVRTELRTVHARLMERMNQFLQTRDLRSIIQEPVVTMRGDRYCIPIKSEYKGQFPGIVHDASTSGATLFIEPATVVELGNRRKELLAREREEVEKVLAKLSGLVGSVAERIGLSLHIVGEIDLIAARAKLAILWGAAEPVLNSSGWIDLISARHPLLEGDVVPIDVRLGDKFNALLITGPNTGGKTVTLKTIGLFALMAASGLQVPAATGTEVALFDKVFADIGDEQSIEQSLSTFSSHMTNIVRIAQEADAKSLVLLDEIGAGTDPAEGAALAKAVLDHLLERGARVVATTHYGELKEFAYMRDGIENACVEFDPETLRPTFRVLMGIPGSSNAFAIAERLGLKKSIVEAARANLGAQAEITEDLIRRLEETHRAAAEKKRLAERSSLDAEALRRRYEEQLKRLEDARERVEFKARKKAESIIESYSRRLDMTLEQLSRQTRDTKRAQDLKKKAERLLDRFEEESVVPVQPVEETEEPLDSDTSLAPGTQVRIAGVHQNAQIIEPPEDGRVVVLVGAMRVKVPISSLRKAKVEREHREAVPTGESAIAVEKARELATEISLRGMRVEPAMQVIEKYLDDAMAAGIQSVRIIHGKGTGEMRKAVWEFLKDHPGVGSFKLGEPEEGGAGATVVEMKK